MQNIDDLTYSHDSFALLKKKEKNKLFCCSSKKKKKTFDLNYALLLLLNASLDKFKKKKKNSQLSMKCFPIFHIPHFFGDRLCRILSIITELTATHSLFLFTPLNPTG